MNIKNVYELLNVHGYDPNVEHNKGFILRQHQVVPKYYILTNKTTNKLILNYSLGSGKTGAATFMLLDSLNSRRILEFLLTTAISKKDDSGRETKTKTNIIIIGGWQTVAQFETELLRPEFGYITDEQYTEMTRLLNSRVDFKRKLGEDIRAKIISTMHTYIQFYGYQSFFTRCFPNLNLELYNQNIDALITEYERNTIEIDQTFINSVENSIIIVDEMQKLYSNNGLNTFGFAVLCLSKIINKIASKLILLSGTIINSSLHEVPDILNIMRDDSGLIKYDDLLQQEIVLENIPIYRFKPGVERYCIDILKDRFMQYDHTRILENNKPTIKKSNNMTQLIFPKRNLLPTEIHIGNKFINSDMHSPMLVYSVQVSGFQDEKYAEYIQSHSKSNTLEETESELYIHIQDAAIPAKSKYQEHNIYVTNNVIQGSILDLNKLKNYSALGVEVYNICLNNSFKNEKTIVYHSQINNFGIKQYEAILRHNGFVKYESNPINTSICKFCHNSFLEHTKDLKYRLANKICNEFVPMYYNALTGELTKNERDVLTNNIYNGPENLYGKYICVLFVSDVAYAGVSFLNTNNLIIISRIPNISKWKQIYSRIIRTRSHSLLPDDKQYAQIYTMIIELKDELKRFPVLGKYTYGEKYYKLRELLNTDISTFTNNVGKECISNTLLNNPSSYPIPPDVESRLDNLFSSDLVASFDLIIRRIFVDGSTRIWSKDVLIKRIKDSSVSVIYLDLSSVPDDIIEEKLIKNKHLTFFQYETDPNVYIKSNDDYNTLSIGYDINRFTFQQIENVNMKNKNISAILNALRTEQSRVKIISMLTKIVELINKKYNLLIDKDSFWTKMFEIGNEYYDGDETRFFKNHARKNRSINTMSGCYYGNIIIRKDGTTKIINYSFPSINGFSKIPYIFKVTCVSLSENSPFYIHVNIIKLLKEEIIDMRRINTGINCYSMPTVTDLYKYFPNISDFEHKKEFCHELLFELCDYQLAHPDEKGIYNPFEK